MGDVSWRTGRQRGSRQTPLAPGSELSAHRVTGSAHDSETPGIAARSWKASEPQDQGPSPWLFKPQQGTRESFLKPGEPWPCPAGCDGPSGPVGHPEAPRHLLALGASDTHIRPAQLLAGPRRLFATPASEASPATASPDSLHVAPKHASQTRSCAAPSARCAHTSPTEGPTGDTGRRLSVPLCRSRDDSARRGARDRDEKPQGETAGRLPPKRATERPRDAAAAHRGQSPRACVPHAHGSASPRRQAANPGVRQTRCGPSTRRIIARTHDGTTP